MTFPSPTKLTCGLFLAVTLLLGAMASSAQAAAPAWRLRMSHSPSTFQRQDFAPTYAVTVENSGDEATAGVYVLDDTLPSELKVVNAVAGEGWICPSTEEVIAGAPLICSSETVLQPGESVIALTVGLNTPQSTPDTVTNDATVSGGGVAMGASASDPAHVIDRPLFDIQQFTARGTEEDESDYTVAGGHPYQATTSFSLPTYTTSNSGEVTPVEDMMDANVELPAGFVGNAAMAPRCRIVKLAGVIPLCPLGSVVGSFELESKQRGAVAHPIYNLVPEHGYPAEFAFKIGSNSIALYPVLRPRTGSYGITFKAFDTQRFSAFGFKVTLFGIPSARNGFGGPEMPLLTNPVDCSAGPQVSRIAIDSWVHPGKFLPNGSPDLSDPNWKTASATSPPVTGCESPGLTSQFRPTIDARPVQAGGGPIQADQPTGLKVGLEFPQSNDPTDPNTVFDPSIPQAPEPKNATVELPAGLSVSPSAADGLAGCSDLASDPAGDQVDYDTTEPVSCPDASKIGTAIATSPLLAAHDPQTDAITGPEPIDGDVYLIKPHPGDLPFGANQEGTFRLLIQLESARNGINVKLPGTVEANQSNGQLTATFEENPQLPVSHLELDLNSGPRAPLATPVTCGTFTTTTDLVPWSTPGTPDATPSSSFAVGSGCAATPQQRPFAPALSAGTESTGAGKTSPFVLHLTRNDGEQEFSSLDLTTPKGFTAALKGVPYCPEAAIAAAGGKSGVAEQASPSCPAASRVGTLTTGAGPGSNPFYVGGKVYLAGPYKGAPLSLVFITPAVAGPFDLGNVVIRAAAFVDPETAQVTVKTDAIPQILDGVPLRIRSIAARIDRPGFTLNPTNCEPMAVNTSIAGASGASAAPANGFQVGDCAKLAFKPKLSVSIKGGHRRGAFQKLKAVLTQPAGQANIAKVSVALPHSEFLEQGHIRTICTRVQFNAGAGNGAGCPKGSIYGRARAVTPLLDEPLEGPVYLRSSNHKLPDLVAALHGQIDIDLDGRIDSVHGGIRNSFEMVPDAPVSKFVLQMKGGKKSLLVNSRNICASSPRAAVKMEGQNGKRNDSSIPLATTCGKKSKKPKKK